MSASLSCACRWHRRCSGNDRLGAQRVMVLGNHAASWDVYHKLRRVGVVANVADASRGNPTVQDLAKYDVVVLYVAGLLAGVGGLCRTKH